MRSYPAIREPDIQAALAYAAELARDRAYPQAEYAGIIVLRPKRQDKQRARLVPCSVRA